jgi:histidyl-tRNA synthetase
MIKAITGTKDILPEDIIKWNKVEQRFREVMNNFNYKEIRTPVFEETALFSRGIGEATDIVSKEMYTFIDRSDTSISLKPEMTASVVRAFIEHSLGKKYSLNKLFYISPMFRQERPQAGRFRQFHQFGAEALGIDNPMLDAEMIITSYKVMKELGLKNLTVNINSLGIPSSRENYKNKLKEYLRDKFDQLSEESKNRFETNILRIFDSKIESDQMIMSDAPLLIDYLDEDSKEKFNQVTALLDGIKIPYKVNPKLVRGLDYYTHTTFEILSSSVGAQSALCGGGRYNLLVEQLGGSSTPGVGFAAGIERILLACENEKCLNLPEDSIDIYVVRLNTELEQTANEIAVTFRNENLSTELDYTQRSVKAQMREANRLKAKYTVILGGEEFERGEIVLKNMELGEQKLFKINDLNGIISTVKN